MKVRFTRSAGSQVRAIGQFIAAESPRAASRVVGSIHEACALLADFPEIGHRVGESGRREWLVRGAPCVLVYRFDRGRDELTIVAVYHTSRNRPRN